MAKQRFKFESRPFIMNENFSKVFIPNRTVSIAEKTGDRSWICVHTCKQFKTYQTYKTTGIKIIPLDATCPIGGSCMGCYRVINNILTNRKCVVATVYKNKQKI